MSEILSQLSDNQGARRTFKRVGRGLGSGKGKTCGRGYKGQKSRSGVAIHGFEGGQMPIHRRLPKRGFKNFNRKVFEVINTGDIQYLIDNKKIKSGAELTKESLKAIGAISGNKDGLKLLNKGELTASVKISVDKASESAIESVKKAGGSVNLPEAKKQETKAKTKKA